MDTINKEIIQQHDWIKQEQNKTNVIIIRLAEITIR